MLLINVLQSKPLQAGRESRLTGKRLRRPTKLPTIASLGTLEPPSPWARWLQKLIAR